MIANQPVDVLGAKKEAMSNFQCSDAKFQTTRFHYIPFTPRSVDPT